MARVAANQDRAVKLRAEYIYRQHIQVAIHRTNGKLAREEKADYVVTPTPAGTKKELTHIEGRYLKKGQYLDFEGKPVPEPDSLDGDLVTLLGTDLPGIGFNVEYRRFDEGVWFPVSFGTEFRLRAVFFINRDVSVSLENSSFEHARVESKIRDFKPISLEPETGHALHWF